MCMVIINYKDNNKKYDFFVCHMPDAAALNIINVNVDCIEVASMQKENCNTNISDAKQSNTKK